MPKARQRYYRAIFLTAAVYDIVLGIVFTFFAGWAFGLLDVRDALPGGAYVPLIGAFLLVIGIAYVFVFFGDLERNRDLIAVGALYKAAYSGIAFYYWAIGDYPHVLFATLFGVVDAVMLVMMAECWWYLYRHRSRMAEPSMALG
jgi:hypothetical protein